MAQNLNDNPKGRVTQEMAPLGLRWDLDASSLGKEETGPALELGVGGSVSLSSLPPSPCCSQHEPSATHMQVTSGRRAK